MEQPNKITIAIIGGGKGGKALLDALSLIPEVRIKYLYDIDPHPAALAKATARGIPAWHTSEQLDIILTDPSLHLILEVTGDPVMYRTIDKRRLKSCRLIGGEETLILFHLLSAQQRTALALDQCRLELEERVKVRTGRLEEVNRELLAKIEETQSLNNALQQVNDMKTRYLLMATHQLKAPFAAIQSYVELMLEGYSGTLNDSMRTTLEKIRRRCLLLSSTIKEMLELANLKTYLKNNMVRRPVRIGAIIREIMEENASRCARRKLTVRYDARLSGDTQIVVNPQQIHTLGAILLDNAINYSHDGSTITTSLVRLKEDRLTLKISDEGIGIPPEHIDQICREYFRCNNAVSQHQDGSGLGLAIAHEIVQLHGFTMRFASEPGEGTTVTVEMPIAATAISPRQQDDYAKSAGF